MKVYYIWRDKKEIKMKRSRKRKKNKTFGLCPNPHQKPEVSGLPSSHLSHPIAPIYREAINEGGR